MSLTKYAHKKDTILTIFMKVITSESNRLKVSYSNLFLTLFPNLISIILILN